MSVDLKAERLQILSGSNWYTLTDSSTSSPTAVEPSGSLTRAADGNLYKSVGGGNWGQLGLYSLIMREVPTTSSTGLNTWGNQPAGFTVNNGTQGMTVFGPGAGSTTNLGYLIRAVPAAPYKVTVLIACLNQFATNSGMIFGWASGSTNSSGVEAVVWKPTAPTNLTDALGVARWTNSTTFSSEPNIFANPFFGGQYWFQLRDDGASLTASVSPSGDDDQWTVIQTMTKSGGFLGPNGYNYIVFGVVPFAGYVTAKIISWKIS